MKKTTANLTAVKNALCRIEDNLTKVWLHKKLPQELATSLFKSRIDIDKCVELLEQVIKNL